MNRLSKQKAHLDDQLDELASVEPNQAQEHPMD